MQTTSSRSTRPLPKRRRLNPMVSYAATTPTELIAPKITPKTSSSSICASCHRASTATAILFCSRCASPTCAVCSRTCNATLSDASPTPRPSVSPPPTNGSIAIPRRQALALNAANTNADAHAPPAAIKRKKPSRHSDSDEDKGHEPCDDSEGCGRIVCRACCAESPKESTTTCYDCDGRGAM